MRKTLIEIALLIQGEIVGDKNLVITGLNGIEQAQKGDLTFLAHSKYLPFIKKSQATAFLTTRDMKIPDRPIIRTDNPALAFVKLAQIISEETAPRVTGIHDTTVIAPSVTIGRNPSIGPFTVIEENVCIGDDVSIGAGCFIGRASVIGRGCLISSHVSIQDKVEVGSRVTIHSGTVIGSDGFGFEEEENGKHIKVPQIGTVVIEDDVAIGANVTIDRARFGKTLIGRGTKIDNLVQIAHNVQIGENCLIVAQVGLSGSSSIGKGTVMAGQSGVVGHVVVGAGSIITAQSGVTKSIPPGSKVFGMPAKPFDQAKKVNAYVQRLPLYVALLQEIKKRLEAIEDRFKHETKNNKK